MFTRLSADNKPSGIGDSRHIYCIVGVLLLGFIFTLINIDLPVVRISHFYASAVQGLFDHQFNPLPVIADETLSYGRPLFFSLLAAPFAVLFGINAGLVIASFLGTAFFVVTAYFFFKRMNQRFGIDQRLLPLELLLLFFNPLLIYQFWSAYPDSLLAGQFLLAYILTDRIVHEPNRDPRFSIAMLGVTIYAAITTKLFGAILGLAVPLYVLLNLRDFFQSSPYRRSRIVWMVATFAVLGVLMLLALMGKNPTLDFATDGSRNYSTGFSELSSGLGLPNLRQVVSTLSALLMSFVVCLHLALLYLLPWFSQRSSDGEPVFKGAYLLGIIPLRCLLIKRNIKSWSSTAFAATYVIGMLPFGEYLAYNIRYFIPVLPFLVVAVVLAYQHISSVRLRCGILIVSLLINGLLIVNFNVRQVYQAIGINEALKTPGTSTDFWLDNLRMSEHLIIHKQIQQANQVVPPNGEVHWFSDYYGTSTYGVISQLGFRSDITFRYPENQGDLPRDRPTYLVRHLHNIGYKPLPETLRELFDVTYYANGFDKLTPKLRLLTPNPDLTYAKGESVRLQAEVSERSAASIKGIEFLVDGMVIATDMIPPYETLWQSDALGQFHISARSIGVVETTTRGAWLSIGTPALIRSIGMSTDDAEELTPSGYMYLDSSKLNLMTETDYGFQPQIVGLRFQDIQWSSEQTLAEAYIQFTSTRDDDSDTRLVIRAELSPHAQPLEEKNANLSSRMLTSTVVEWQPEPWEEGDSTRRQRTPNLAPLFDELFAQAQWQPGNAVLFIISGAGERAANSFERAKGSITTPRLSLLGEAGEVVEMTKAVEPRVSLQQAAESYARHCALCHGERGEGNKADYANALFNPDFLAIATDEFINHAIAEGRPGTAMSAWSEAVGGPFSDSEIGALVDYIRSHDDSSQRPLTQADIDIAEFVGDVTRGLPVYQAQCASCHGDSGGGLVAPSLNNPQFLDTVSNAYLYRSIADGRRNTTMPAYQNTLKTETINDLVAVIRSWDENDTQMLPVERSSSPVHIPHIQDVQQKLINPDGDAPNFSLRSGRFVAADDVVAAMRAGKRMLLLDARPPSDWYKARAKGALSTPFYAIEQDAQWIENDGTWVIAYCACPHASSGQVVDELRKRGFLNTAVLDEGIDYWIDRGYPTEYGYEKQP